MRNEYGEPTYIIQEDDGGFITDLTWDEGKEWKDGGLMVLTTELSAERAMRFTLYQLSLLFDMKARGSFCQGEIKQVTQ